MASGQTFSHKLHLKLKLTCVDCHSTAPKSTTVEDNNLPRAEACRKCHEKVTIKQPAKTMLARFNHQFHLQFPNVAPLIARAIDTKSYLSQPGDLRKHLNTANSCVACHRGLEDSDTVSKANFPQMADCLVCHSKVDPPFSCEFCHDKSAQLKPANHTADFLDTHNSGKVKLDKSSCAVCHGRRFTCLGCHQ